MTQPNIVNVSFIYGNTNVLNVTTVSTNVISNGTSSNKVLKINTLLITNINAANSANIIASFYRNGVEYKIANSISVPSKSTLALLSKDISVYLQETDYVSLSASSNNSLHAICSYEEIS